MPIDCLILSVKFRFGPCARWPVRNRRNRFPIQPLVRICAARNIAHVRSFSFKLPPPSGISPYFFLRCSPADSGSPTKRMHVPGSVHTCLRTRVIVQRAYVAFVCARARRWPCARSTLTDAGRKINIKFTSRLCTHVDREPRHEIRTRRNAEVADTQSHCDCVRTWLY